MSFVDSTVPGPPPDGSPTYVTAVFAAWIVVMVATASGKPLPLCTEAESIDLLALSLTATTSLPVGVEVVKVDGRKGYRFDPTAKLFGVPASEVTTRCARFPSEFSLVVTFRKEKQRAESEFLLTLLAPDRRTILLDLRLQHGNLYFEFVDADRRERVTSVLRGERIVDGAWHTIAVAVAGKSVKFTLDCVDDDRDHVSELSSPFPTSLDTTNTRFHIGNRRRRRNRFTGLLSQVKLVAGADATLAMCSTTLPYFVPEWIKSAYYPFSNVSGSGKHEMVRYVKDDAVVTCGAGNKGELMYRERQGELRLCGDEDQWMRLASAQEKFDYVIDSSDLPTRSKSLDVEIFRIPGEGLFLASANQGRGRNMNSTVYKWDGGRDGFRTYQDIATNHARGWKFFSIEAEYFLALANDGSTDDNAPTASAVYRWSVKLRKFLPHQYMRTFSARSIDVFDIDGKTFLVVANYAGKSDHKAMTWIYMWGADHRAFVKYQPLESVGAYDVEYFRIGKDHFIALANSFNGLTTRLHSVVYRWRMSNFVPHQYLETIGATDWEHFEIDGRHFLAVANYYDEETKRYEVNSTIFVFREDRRQFVKLQDLPTHGARDFEFFTVGRDSFLIGASSSDSNDKLNNVIYRWQGMEHFVPIHSFPVYPCSDWESFRGEDGQQFLVSAMSANVKPRNSKVLKILTY